MTLPRTTINGSFLFLKIVTKLAKDAAFAVAKLLFLGDMRSFYIFLEMSRKKIDAN